MSAIPEVITTPTSGLTVEQATQRLAVLKAIAERSVRDFGDAMDGHFDTYGLARINRPIIVEGDRLFSAHEVVLLDCRPETYYDPRIDGYSVFHCAWSRRETRDVCLNRSDFTILAVVI